MQVQHKNIFSSQISYMFRPNIVVTKLATGKRQMYNYSCVIFSL
jgi:hypothetical protein